MKTKSIGKKIITITVLSIIIMNIIIISVLCFSVVSLVTKIFTFETKSSMNALFEETEDIKKTSFNIVTNVAELDTIKNAIEAADSAEIRESFEKAMTTYASQIDIVTITNNKGDVITRINSDKSGDSVLSQKNIVESLAGKANSKIEQSADSKLAIISATPVKNSNGQIIGVISGEYKLDNTSFADRMKRLTGADITIFLKDEIINTTIENDGKRVIGTKIDAAISKIVLEQKQNYIAAINLFGIPYTVNYQPLSDEKGDVIGAFFTGKSKKLTRAFGVEVTIYGVSLLAVVTLLIAIILAIYFKRTVTIPLNKIKTTLNEVASGNLDVEANSNSPDEIGELTRATRKLLDSIQRLTTKMDTMSQEFYNGDIDARIDQTLFQGAYKIVVKNINDMVNGIVSETLLFLNCTKEIGSGHFHADIPKQPGKKVIFNEALDSIRDNLKAVSNDISTLVDEASMGKLDNRVDPVRYKGDWVELITGLNKLMDAVSNPISEAAEVLKQVSEGDFNSKLQGDYYGDFLIVKNSINYTVVNVASYINEISDVLGEISQDNLDQEINREYIGDFSNIKDALNKIISRFNNVISDILSAANQVDVGSKQISQSSMMLAEGATQQASTVQEINATIMTINENTIKNAQNAKEAEHLSIASKNSATKGDNAMQNMLRAMEGIKVSSSKISNVIKVIEDIAFQTNLLALNAAVEAARAGQHGKGFAVVAEEVRNLASRSKNAVKETATLIDESIASVNDGMSIANTTADALQTIVSEVTKVTSIIANITLASHEQAESIGDVTTAISQIANGVQNNAAAAEKSASASIQLSSEATALKSLVSVFKSKK